jgi:nucleoid-associated protein YgaU
MGIFSFLANTGKKIFGGKDETPAQPNVAANAAVAVAQNAQAGAVRQHVQSYGLNIQGFDVQFAGDGDLILRGQAATKADYEKAALLAGNVMGISRVDNQITFPQATEPDSQTYEVKSGDNLSKISKQFYGDPNLYMKIVKANQPMIKNPDEIYPGQVLRIPAKESFA